MLVFILTFAAVIDKGHEEHKAKQGPNTNSNNGSVIKLEFKYTS